MSGHILYGSVRGAPVDKQTIIGGERRLKSCLVGSVVKVARWFQLVIVSAVKLE